MKLIGAVASLATLMGLALAQGTEQPCTTTITRLPPPNGPTCTFYSQTATETQSTVDCHGCVLTTTTRSLGPGLPCQTSTILPKTTVTVPGCAASPTP